MQLNAKVFYKHIVNRRHRP